MNKEIAQKKKAKEDADDLIAQSKGYDEKIKNAEAACDALILRRDDILKKIGNLVHDSVPISDNEDLNAIVRADGLDRVLPADKVKEFKTVKVCDCPCPYPVFKGLSTVNPEIQLMNYSQELDDVVAKIPGKLSHVDLVPMLGIADWEKGSATAGNRGYYLVGDGVLLNQVGDLAVVLSTPQPRIATRRAKVQNSSCKH